MKQKHFLLMIISLLSIGTHITQAQNIVTVTNTNDSGEGSLREAINIGNQISGTQITFAPYLASDTITLLSDLPFINETDIAIEGNGITISGDRKYGIFRVQGANVKFSRIHFIKAWKKGNKDGIGGYAIQNIVGNVEIQSCIFSDIYDFPPTLNVISEHNDAPVLYNYQGKMTVQGCTFYNNQTNMTYTVGDLSGEITLIGNLFIGNKGWESCNNVGISRNTTIIAEYNVYDTDGNGMTSITNQQLSSNANPLVPETFRLHSGNEAVGILTDLPGTYPRYDFYGNPINNGANAGAVQGLNNGYSLFYTVKGEAKGQITSSATPNIFKELPANSSVTLTAPAPANGKQFLYWTVNGMRIETAGSQFTFVMNEDKRIEAVFGRKVSVTTVADSGLGSLRNALENLQDYDLISFDEVLAGDTITLKSDYPVIERSVTIDANGITIDSRDYYTAFNTMSDIDVRLNRIRFISNLNNERSWVILNNANLYVSSCIFKNSSVAYGLNSNIAGDVTLYGNSFHNSNVKYESYLSGSFVYKGPFISLQNVFKKMSGINGKYSEYGNLYYYDDGTNGVENSAFDGQLHIDTDNWIIRVPQSEAVPAGLNTFRPKQDGVADKRIPEGSAPFGYPTTDFYGDAVTYPASVGAVQTLANTVGFRFVTQTNGHGKIQAVYENIQPDEDNLLPAGAKVKLIVQPEENCELRWWAINGERQPNAALQNDITIDKDAAVYVTFSRNVNVTTTADDMDNVPQGSLREALKNADHFDVIRFADSLTGDTLVLKGALPEITKEITIEGNGIVISGDDQYHFMDIPGEKIENMPFKISSTSIIIINRVHFTKGYSNYTSYGSYHEALIKGKPQGDYYDVSIADLYLNSCIFTDNYGYISVPNYINGCTFYGNTGGRYGREGMWPYDPNLFVQNNRNCTGNLFYKNTYEGISGNYNVTDDMLSRSPFSPVSFRLSKTSEAAGVIPASDIPENYPAVDFYGNDMRGKDLAAGAVQEKVNGNFLTYNATGPGKVELITGDLDHEGLVVSGTVTLQATASEGDGNAFRYWMVDNVRVDESLWQLTIAMDKDKSVTAVFGKDILVNTTADNAIADDDISLRKAIDRINNATEADGAMSIVIDPKFAGDTIVLTSALPNINKSVVIEGNGIIISGNGKYRIMSLDSDSQSGAKQITIKRVHFTNGYSWGYGSAISSYNQLYSASDENRITIQSCIFSNNTNDNGYALYFFDLNSVSITKIEGCTFYGNTNPYTIDCNQLKTGGWSYLPPSQYYLNGNLFFGNIVNNQQDIEGDDISSKYNVFDQTNDVTVLNGEGDKLITECPINTTSFMPTEDGLQMLKIVSFNTLPEFPLTDFYGVRRTETTLAGAVVKPATTITIYYMPQNGEEQFSQVYSYEELTQGLVINEPVAPVRTGYHFRGWYKEAECNNVWNFSTDKITQNNMTLYAKWELVAYAISYELNGGKNHPGNPTTYTIKDGTITLLDPTRTNYIFDGWVEGNTIPSGSRGDRTFTARWQSIPVSGVSLNKEELTLMVGEEETLVATIEPSNATNKNIRWESRDPDIAVVDDKGKVTAISEGSAWIVAVANGDEPSGMCFVTVTPASNAISSPTTNAVAVYPNPVKDELFIKSILPIKQIGIYSLTGALIISESSFNEKIAVSALPKGVYMVKIYMDNGTTVKKIMKE